MLPGARQPSPGPRQQRLGRVRIRVEGCRDLSERAVEDVVQDERRPLAGRELLQGDHHGEAHVVTEDDGSLRVAARRVLGPQRWPLHRIHQHAPPPLDPQPAHVIEAHRGRDAEQPSVEPFAVGKVPLALDGARDCFLAQIVGIASRPGHPVAQAPDPLAMAFDGGK